MKYHIREAKLEDIKEIIECGKHFFEYAKFNEKGLFLCEKSFGKEVELYISSSNGIILLLMDGNAVVGGICGAVVPWAFNNSVKMCHEFFYWVEPEHRGLSSIRLYKKFEKQAIEEGAKFVHMITPNTELNIDGLYQRLGFKYHESGWIKEL